MAAHRHVLLLPSWYPTSRAPQFGTFFREQALALHDFGMRVGVVSPEVMGLAAYLKAGRPSTGIAVEDDHGVPTHRKVTVPLLPRFSRRNALYWMRAGKALFESYVSENGMPDLLHAHSALYGGMLAYDLRQQFGVPYVITEHHTAFARGRVRRWAQRKAAKAFAAAHARLVVSPHAGTQLTAQFQEAFCPWQTIPNTLDRRFEAPLDRSPRAYGEGGCRFLSIGFFRKQKAQDLLIRAFADRFRGEAEVRLGLAGDGSTLPDCRALAAECGVESQVDFLGLLDRDAVWRELQASDVFVLPSYYETFGVVAIEALASGLPVIATRCGGPESIVNDTNGVLVPPGDVAALSGAMVDMRARIGQYDPETLRRDCLSLYSSRAIAERLAILYEAILPARPEVTTPGTS